MCGRWSVRPSRPQERRTLDSTATPNPAMPEAAAPAAPATPTKPVRPAHARLCIVLLVLLGFALGCSEFVVIGIEPELARDFGVSLAQVGQLISLFSITYAVLTPILALVTLPAACRLLSRLRPGQPRRDARAHLRGAPGVARASGRVLRRPSCRRRHLHPRAGGERPRLDDHLGRVRRVRDGHGRGDLGGTSRGQLPRLARCHGGHAGVGRGVVRRACRGLPAHRRHRRACHRLRAVWPPARECSTATSRRTWRTSLA